MDPKTFQFDLPASGRPNPFVLPEEYYPGVHDYMKKRSKERPKSVIDSITTLVIHATAGGSSSGAMEVMKTGKTKIKDKIENVQVSWHWLVPDEDEKQHGKYVWACVWESRVAYHVRDSVSHKDINDGRKGVNAYSLGVEIVNTQNNDKFSDWQLRVTATIARYCWAKYPNMKHIVSHAKLDPSRRSDPGSHFPWDNFRKLVLDGPALPGVEKEILLSELPAEIKPSNDCCSIA